MINCFRAELSETLSKAIAIEIYRNFTRYLQEIYEKRMRSELLQVEADLQARTDIKSGQSVFAFAIAGETSAPQIFYSARILP